MSKIASNEKLDGPNLRKAIDYFCHLAVAPNSKSILKTMIRSLQKTDYFKAMSWLKTRRMIYLTLVTRTCSVFHLSEFSRGKMSDLVSLLSEETLRREILRNLLLLTHSQE